MINAKRIEEMKRLSTVVPPGPWTSGEGYEQMDPGYYFADARGYIAFADEEGTVSPETIEFIAESRQFVPDIIAAYEEQAVEIEKLRKALAYYADESHYVPYVIVDVNPCDITEDGGYIARDALKRKERII